MNLRRIMLGCLVVCMVLAMPATLIAQNDGQFCLRAYEDRNGNGVRDGGDPAITRGIGAVLMDVNNVIVQTAIMEDSPTAGNGVICFLNLSSQQYTMMVTSPDFTATTGDNMTVSIQSGVAPPVLEYGGERIVVTAANTDVETATNEDDLVERALVAGAGAVGAMLLMAILGLIIGLIFFRGGGQPQPAYPPQMPPNAQYRRPTDTGAYPTNPSDTGQYPRQ